MSDLLDKARQLEEQLRSDDREMTAAPWTAEADSLYHSSEDDGTIELARFTDDACVNEDSAIARTRNAIPVIADTLRDLCAELSNAKECWDDCERDNVKLACELNVLKECDTVRAELTAALARVKELEAGIDRASTVLAEQGWPGLAEQMRRLAGKP